VKREVYREKKIVEKKSAFQFAALSNLD